MIIIMSNEINHFIQTLDSEDGVHKNTIISYKYDINQFGNFIKRRKKSFKSIIKKDIIDFLNSLKQKKVKNKTKSRKIFALKRFYKFLISEKIIKNNPIEKIDIPKSEDTLSITLTSDSKLPAVNCNFIILLLALFMSSKICLITFLTVLF